MISARLPIADLPNVFTASVIASEIFVPPSGMMLVSSSFSAVDRRVVINRERRLQKRAPGKRDEAHAVAAQFAKSNPAPSV